MKIKLHGVKRVFIKSEYIKLDALLKYASIVATGGEAKHLIQYGDVLVGGEVCTQRGKKIKHGDTVTCSGVTLLVKQAGI